MTKAHSAAAMRDHPRKRPGPAPSGTPDIRKGILDASEYLFAARGFAATSIREIAERVGVNPAMVHYYFGSKKKLLQAVMEQVLEPLAGAVAEVEERGHQTSARKLAHSCSHDQHHQPRTPKICGIIGDGVGNKPME